MRWIRLWPTSCVDAIRRLCNAARAISPVASFALEGLEGPGDQWRGAVRIGGIILVEAKGTIEEVTQSVTHKLEHMSHRMMTTLKPAAKAD